MEFLQPQPSKPQPLKRLIAVALALLYLALIGVVIAAAIRLAQPDLPVAAIPERAVLVAMQRDDASEQMRWGTLLPLAGQAERIRELERTWGWAFTQEFEKEIAPYVQTLIVTEREQARDALSNPLSRYDVALVLDGSISTTALEEFGKKLVARVLPSTQTAYLPDSQSYQEQIAQVADFHWSHDGGASTLTDARLNWGFYYAALPTKSTRNTQLVLATDPALLNFFVHPIAPDATVGAGPTTPRAARSLWQSCPIRWSSGLWFNRTALTWFLPDVQSAISAWVVRGSELIGCAEEK